MPAFKQYESEELERIVERIQRPTKSAMLRTGHCISDIPATGTEEGEKKDGEEGKKAEEKPPINQVRIHAVGRMLISLWPLITDWMLLISRIVAFQYTVPNPKSYFYPGLFQFCASKSGVGK